MKEELEIKQYLNGKLVKLKMRKKVRKSGHGGAVGLPKELIGKFVDIKYEVKKK